MALTSYLLQSGGWVVPRGPAGDCVLPEVRAPPGGGALSSDAFPYSVGCAQAEPAGDVFRKPGPPADTLFDDTFTVPAFTLVR